MLIKLPEPRSLHIHRFNASAKRKFGQGISTVTELATEFRIPVGVEEAPNQPIRLPHHHDDLRLGDILPRHHFLKQLQREKRRTDRSKAPLSVALFHLGGGTDGDLSDIEELLAILRASKRDTDILGYLGEDLIALLLVDTNAQGTEGFVEKVLERAKDLPVSATKATYPDELFDNLMTDSQDLSNLNPLFLDHSHHVASPGYVVKRALDVVGSIVLILLLSPLMLLTAFAVAMTSPGPVIFKQTRLGKRGVPFVFYKFRSMFYKNDDRIHREYVASLISGNVEKINQGDKVAPVYKMKADPRVTRIGRIIRKTSIDELPQLFNILKGDMSLVGPRPPLPYEVDKYDSWHLARILEIKPGLTGLWQVEGRSKTTFDEMVRMDLRYIRGCSLLLDLKILLRTVKVVLKCDGAS